MAAPHSLPRDVNNSHASSSSSGGSHARQLSTRAPLTLGIETADDHMCAVIPRDARLPCTATQLFSTYADQQPAVEIKVYQGVSARNDDRPRAIAEIERRFNGLTEGRSTLSFPVYACCQERASTRYNQFLGQCAILI
jgi:hypothetical protein